MRNNVILVCEECNARNYHLKRSQQKSKRLVLRKYCPTCMKTTIHKETK